MDVPGPVWHAAFVQNHGFVATWAKSASTLVTLNPGLLLRSAAVHPTSQAHPDDEIHTSNG